VFTYQHSHNTDWCSGSMQWSSFRYQGNSLEILGTHLLEVYSSLTIPARKGI